MLSSVVFCLNHDGFHGDGVGVMLVVELVAMMGDPHMFLCM
jgi:hypothetical protein